MALSKEEYPAVLGAMPPQQAATVINERVRHVTKLNTEIADWLEERRQVEETYVQGLIRLCRRATPGDTSDLGTFADPWARIVNSIGAIAESHTILARKLESDVEQPLRDYASSNRDIQVMSNMQANMAAAARDYDAATKKADKAKARKGSTVYLSADVDAAKAQWDSTAPQVFEKLQIIDESRFDHLRNVLTQFQTHEVDQVERNRVAAEQCLNALLNIDTADEVKAFSLRAADKRYRPTARTTSSYGLGSSSAAYGGGNDLSLVPSATQTQQDTPSESGEVIEDKKTGRLKRLGTVFGRRRSQLPPKPVPTKTKSGSKLSSGYGPTSEGASTTVPAIPSISEQNWRSPSPGLAADDAFGSSTRAPEENGTPALSNGFPDAPVASSQMNGTAQRDLGQLQEPIQPTPATEPPKDGDGYSVPAAANDPISLAQQEAAANYGESPNPALNLNIRDAPIQEEGADNATALANVANALRAQATPSRQYGTVRGRRDVRNTVFIPSTPAPNLSSEVSAAGTAVAPITATAAAAAAASTAPPTTPGQDQLASPIPTPATFMQSPALPTAQSLPRAPEGDDHGAFDNQSIRSGFSTGTSIRGAAVTKHPDLHEPGLNASIVETVTAFFEQGTVVRASVIGELALAHNDAASHFGHSSAQPSTIRLENFQVLEKVAPNPAFVSQLPDKAGEYAISTARIVAAGVSPTVAFKYQLHLGSPEATAAQAPIMITPTWKIEPTQASVILSYSANPAFLAAAASQAATQPTDTLTLTNVIILIHLDLDTTSSATTSNSAIAGAGTGKPLSCQSKPTGTFAKAQSLIYWRLGDISLRPTDAPQKLLARFQTDGPAKAGQVEARWEVSGPLVGAGTPVATPAVSDGSGGGGRLGVSVLMSSAGGGVASDPFADDDATGGAGAGVGVAGVAPEWRGVPGVRKLVSGSYIGI